ncbi:MAG TPA: acetate/propionate family kinase [Acidisarcina sp.]
MPLTILVLNSGSSSIKFSLFSAIQSGEPRPLYEGALEGIGGGSGTFSITDEAGKQVLDQKLSAPDAHAAFQLIADALKRPPFPFPDAIGHRMVSGGPTLTAHQRITPAVLDEMERHVAFAPLHSPVAIFIMRKAAELFPGLPNFVCFDSAFHTTIPEVAARFALPERYWADGVRRYGAHGLSYESVVYQLRDELPSRMVVAHLGNGSSITAIRDGRSTDTSMGLTPTGGIISGTRTGDLDPGVLLYILRELEPSRPATKEAADQLEAIVARQSGLLGVSGLSNDMRALRKGAEQGDEAALRALAQFAYVIRKFLGSYLVLLGGLDALVFTGGIGEHDAQTRAEVTAGLEPFGLTLAPERNISPEGQVISTSEAKVRILIVPAREDLLIAMHTVRLLGDQPEPAAPAGKP